MRSKDFMKVHIHNGQIFLTEMEMFHCFVLWKMFI